MLSARARYDRYNVTDSRRRRSWLCFSACTLRSLQCDGGDDPGCVSARARYDRYNVKAVTILAVFHFTLGAVAITINIAAICYELKTSYTGTFLLAGVFVGVYPYYYKTGRLNIMAGLRLVSKLSKIRFLFSVMTN